MDSLKPPLLSAEYGKIRTRSLQVSMSDPGCPRLTPPICAMDELPEPNILRKSSRLSASDSDLVRIWTQTIGEEMKLRYKYLAEGHKFSPEALPQRLDQALPAEGRSSEVATVLVILKAFVGGTMLVLPAALLQTGLVSGNITLWAVGLLELWCMLLLLQAHRSCGGSFCELAEKALGRAGSVAVEASIVLSQLGFTAAEMIYVAKSSAFVLRRLALQSEYGRRLMGDADEADLEPILIGLQFLLCVPVSWYRELSALTVFNFVGNFMIFGALLVLSLFTTEGLMEEGRAYGVRLSSSVSQVLVFAGFSVFAFEGITMVIPIYTAHKNKESFSRTLSWTIVAIIVLFSVFSSSSVVRYGDFLEPVLTLNLPESSSLRMWVSCAFAMGSLTLVFLMAFPAYEILESRLQMSCGIKLTSRVVSNAFRSSVVAFCALLAVFGGKQLDYFLSVIGALGCVPLAFVYPSVIHAVLVAKTRSQQIADIVAMFVGLGIMANCIVGLL